MNQPKKIVNPYNKYIFSTKLSLFVSILAIAITALAISMIWYNLKHIENIKAQLNHQSRGIHQSLSSTQQSLNDLTKQLQQQAKVNNTLSQLISRPDKDTETILINQTLSQLQLAQLQLTTQVNTATSIVLLTQANHALSQLPHSLGAPYKQKISAIINNLKIAEKIDVSTQIQQLTTLRETILRLSFVPKIQPSTTATATATATTIQNQTTTTATSKWSQISHDLTHYLDHLITVRYHTIPQQPLADTQQENNFKQYLLLKVSESEWALLNNDNALYQQALNDIAHQTTEIVSDQQHKINLLAQITDLQKIHFGYNRAQLINEIDSLITDLAHTQSPSTDTPKTTVSSKKPAAKEPTPESSPKPTTNASVEI